MHLISYIHRWFFFFSLVCFLHLFEIICHIQAKPNDQILAMSKRYIKQTTKQKNLFNIHIRGSNLLYSFFCRNKSKNKSIIVISTFRNSGAYKQCRMSSHISNKLNHIEQTSIPATIVIHQSFVSR